MNGKDGDIVLTEVAASDGVKGIRNRLTDEMLRVESELLLGEAVEKVRDLDCSVLHKAAVDGDIKNGSVVVGQKVCLLNVIEPASVMMTGLISGYPKITGTN